MHPILLFASYALSFSRRAGRRWQPGALLALLSLLAVPALAQTGIGTTSPNPKAALDVSATDKGLLIPRLTQAQRTAITAPPDGLMVFQTDGTTGFWYYFGGAWVNIPNANTSGDNLGNHTATQKLDLAANKLVGNGGTTGLSIANGGTVTTDGALTTGGPITAGGTVDLQGNKLTGTATSISGVGVGVTSWGGLNLGQSSGNVYMGYDAGLTNSTGFDNTFVGYQAGRLNNTGNDNTIFGYRAGRGVSTGSSNAFMGSFSGTLTTTGNDNTFVGRWSGQHNTTGSRNLALGYDAGPASGSTALTNAGAIGYNAKVSQSNSLVLGGTGSDAVNVGIGTTAPLGRLDIQGGADALGANDPYALAFQHRNGGYRHWVRSRHNSSVTGVGNDLDFYLNNSGSSTGSSAPGTGNLQVLTLESNNGQPRVGIGTTTPTATLDVSGATSTVKLSGLAGTGTRLMTVDASGNVSSSAALPAGVTGDNLGNHTATTNLNLAGNKLVGSGGTQGISVTSTGFVGIGTTTISGNLHAVANANDAANDYILEDYRQGNANRQWLVQRAADGTQASPADLGDGTTTPIQMGGYMFSPRAGGTWTGSGFFSAGMSGNYRGDGTTGLTELRFRTSNADRMTISPTGQLGLGTTAPAATLHVSGSGSTVRLEGLGDGSTTRVVTVSATGTLGAVATNSLADNLGNHTATQNLNLGASALVGNAGTQGLTISSGGAIGVGSGLTNPAAGGAQLANMAVNTVGSDNQGGYFSGGSGSLQWGIGGPGYAGTFYNGSTAANGNGLAVKVEGSNSGATAFDVSKGGQNGQGAPLLTVKAAGYVGIGTSNPTTALDVNGTATAKTYTFPISNANDDAGPVITSREIPATQGNTQSGTDASRPTELILFHSNDGTTNNGGADQITLRAPQLSFQTYNNTTVNTVGDDNGYNPRLTIAPDGDVKINALAGTGTRMVTADAAGALATQAVPADTDAQTLSISGSTITISGSSSSVTVPSSADNLGNHTAMQVLNLGANALAGTGASIGTTVGVGVRADGGLNIGQNTTGRNISIGYQAGEAAATGTDNLAIGYQSGRATTTGYGNLTLGYQSGYNNQTGNNNLFLGYQSGYTTTSGFNNLFFGYESGYSTTTGSNNHFLGYESGRANTGGSNNVFNGYRSGYVNVGGQQNVFEGVRSGIANTSGSYNAFVGFESGENNTSGANNAALGYEAGPSTGNLTNTTALGYKASVSQSNSLVLGGTGANAVQVGIGTTAPAATLHVEGATSTVRLAGLAGADTRMVTADASGNLSAATIPTGESTTATNGLTLTGTAVGLGGALTSATAVSTTAANTLTVNGVGALSLGTGTGAVSVGNTTGATAISGNGITLVGTTDLNTAGAGNTNIGTNTNSGTVTIGHASGTANSVVLSGNVTLNGGTSNATTNLGTGAGAVSLGNSTGATALSGSSIGLTGTTNVNTTGSAATNLGTGASAGAVTIGRSGGTVTVGNLAGTGTRVVTANATGQLSTVTTASLGDNLGDHTVTQNLNLSTHTLTGNGGTTGLQIGTNGRLLTTADNLVAGKDAGNGSLSGINNTVLGAQSGSDLTTGAANTLVGVNAGASLTSGTDNTFLGIEAGAATTTGDANVFVGTGSGDANQTGSGLTLLGPNTDVSGPSLSNATAIGKSATVSQSNSLVLGGTGVDAVSVGIGTTAPAATLHVAGASSTVRLAGLAGTGTRVVTADADGDLATVASASLADNLGNHTASQNLNLGANRLVGNGGTTGLYLGSNGQAGLGSITPSLGQLSNTTTNVIGADNQGVNFTSGVGSLVWAMSTNGYVGAFYNGSTLSNGNGLAVKIDGTNAAASVLDVSTGAQGTAGTSRLVVKADGKVGIGASSPSSGLTVSNTTAFTPTNGVVGGASGSPVALSSTSSTYLGLSPGGSSQQYYQLPDPSTCPGRMYILRNNSGANSAILSTAGGSLYNGSGSGSFTSYTLNTNAAGKTIIVFSDGSNWTIGQLN